MFAFPVNEGILGEASGRPFKVMRRVVVSGKGLVCGVQSLGKEWSGVEWLCREGRRRKSEQKSAKEIWKVAICAMAQRKANAFGSGGN